MPNYLRLRREGGMFFLTIVTHERRSILCADFARKILHDAIERVRWDHPFQIRAMVLLPDHLHALWVMPQGDCDYVKRVSLIKKRFTDGYLAAGGSEGTATPGRLRHRIRGVWEKRYWEHTIRNYRDYKEHLDYVHFNPVRHGLVEMAKDWPWSTFRSFVAKGEYSLDWRNMIGRLPGADFEPDEW